MFSYYYVLLFVNEPAQKEYLKRLIKPSVMTLISLYTLFGKHKLNLFLKCLFIGYIFSLAGDSFLLFEGEFFFILGLGSFAVAHIFYIIAFSSNVLTSNTKNAGFFCKTLAISFYIFAYFMNQYLQNYVPLPLQIPVTFYSVLLSSMVAVALLRQNKVNSKGFYLIMSGALLFAASDSILSFNLFVPAFQKQTLVELAVMVTYYTAQFLIYLGGLDFAELGMVIQTKKLNGKKLKKI